MKTILCLVLILNLSQALPLSIEHQQLGNKLWILNAFKMIGKAFKASVNDIKSQEFVLPTLTENHGIISASLPRPLAAFHPTRIGNHQEFFQNRILRDVEQLALAMTN